VSFSASELKIDLKPVETVLVRMDTAKKVSLRMIELVVDENNSNASALVVYFTLVQNNCGLFIVKWAHNVCMHSHTIQVYWNVIKCQQLEF